MSGGHDSIQMIMDALFELLIKIRRRERRLSKREREKRRSITYNIYMYKI